MLQEQGDCSTMHTKFGRLSGAVLLLLGVLPAAAESLRQQMMAQHDQASRRVTQAMLDVARVLTPEQRAKLGERMRERQAIMKDRMERMEREHERMMQGRPMPPASGQPRQ